MTKIDLNQPQGAIFSEDGAYRYALWRIWNPTKPPLVFNGLNPSKASSTVNDPTVYRLMVRAGLCGYGGLIVGNAHAYVSSDPDALLKVTDPVGLETDDYLRQMVALAENGRVLCGWGSFPAAKKRAPEVLKMIPEPYCLGVNADGQPKHPLYIGYNIPMLPYIYRRGS